MNDRWRDEDRRRQEERERERRTQGARPYGDQSYGGESYSRNTGYGSSDYDRPSFFGGSDYSRTEDYQRHAGGQDQNRGQSYSRNQTYQSHGQPYGQQSDYYGSTWGGSDRDFRKDPYRGASWGGGPQSGYQHAQGYDQGVEREQSGYGRSHHETYAQGGYGRDEGYRREQPYQGYSRNQHHQDDRGREDRSWMDRARDEVGSWFGDEEAERRRRMDAARSGHPYDSRRDDTGWSDRFSGEDRYRREQHDSDRRDRWNRNDW